MANPVLPIVIRHAHQNDFKDLGKLYASALANNESWNMIWGDVNPEVAQEWLWEGVASYRTASSTDTVQVLESTDTHEVMGVIWFSEASKEDKAEFWKAMPEGFNEGELQKVLVPTKEWQAELLRKYGDYIFVEEFAIAPSYQSQGYGKMMLQHVLEVAKAKGMNVALTAAPGSYGFFEKCGFKKMGPPFMCGPDNTVEDTTPMLWEA